MPIISSLRIFTLGERGFASPMHQCLTALMKSVPVSSKIILEWVSNEKIQVDKVSPYSHIQALGEEKNMYVF